MGVKDATQSGIDSSWLMQQEVAHEVYARVVAAKDGPSPMNPFKNWHLAIQDVSD